MKIGFYSPYLDSLAGGERYMLTLASHWSQSHDVSLFWNTPAILHQAQDRLGMDLSHVRTVENVFGTRNIFRKMIVSRGYDVIFFLTDGSVPTTFARYNILHFQVPFQHIQVHPIKLNRFQSIVCNSDFTKRNIDARLGKRAAVIYPPVIPISHSRVTKKNIIFSVGRFHPLKKQDVLIEAFRLGLKKGQFENYELVLTGGLLAADESYLKRLKTSAKNLPVRIVTNISFSKLTSFYNEASVYWHGAGYHETNPERMEHFGISTVEAMSAGAVPVVYNGGGLPEIVRPGEDGFLWVKTEDLVSQTARIIASDKLRRELSKSSIERSVRFSDEQFTAAFDELLTKIIR